MEVFNEGSAARLSASGSLPRKPDRECPLEVARYLRSGGVPTLRPPADVPWLGGGDGNAPVRTVLVFEVREGSGRGRGATPAARVHDRLLPKDWCGVVRAAVPLRQCRAVALRQYPESEARDVLQGLSRRRNLEQRTTESLEALDLNSEVARLLKAETLRRERARKARLARLARNELTGRRRGGVR